MGGVEDNQWFDKFMDEIGLVFTKVDESIQKSIELWKELTNDLFDNQPTQLLTGQKNNGESGEEHSSQYPFVEVKERPIQHWSMCLGEVEEKTRQHWAMRASKTPEILIQEQGDDDFYGDQFDDDDYDEFVDDDDEEEEGEDESWDERKYGYRLLNNVVMSSEDEDEEEEGEDESCDERKYGYRLLNNVVMSSEDEDEEEENEDESCDERKYGYRLLNNVVMSSEDEDESWDEDDDDDDSHYHDEEDEEEDETTVSDSSEIMLELNLGALATTNILSSNNHHNEEDSGSSLKNVDTSSKEDDDVKECHDSEEIEEVVDMLQEHRAIDLSNESLVVHEDQDDVSDKLQDFVDVRQDDITNNTEFGEVVTLFPESDWVFVTRD